MAPPRMQAETRLLVEMIGPPPTEAGDLHSAQGYCARIDHLLDMGEINTLERRQLYKQRAKWRPRADGRDARWMKVGSRSGRLPKPVQEGPIYPSTEEDDPLVRAIEEKFSRKNIARLLRGCGGTNV